MAASCCGSSLSKRPSILVIMSAHWPTTMFGAMTFEVTPFWAPSRAIVLPTPIIAALVAE